MTEVENRPVVVDMFCGSGGESQGLKKGEKIRKICECICISNRPEPLSDIRIQPVRNGTPETEREGFPAFTPEMFIGYFCGKMEVTENTQVNRIEFVYVWGSDV